ncbi:MAG: hypothetical protein U1E73_03260 [Planctomycetota bacterium]
MGLIAAALSLCLPQDPAGAVPTPVPLLPEVVLAGAAEPVPLAAFGLGEGGIDDERVAGSLRAMADGCITPRGVRVQCQPAGVKLVFPSGRELLVAPDGFVHLRSGEAAGPFPAGLELRLGDGAMVRVGLAQAERDRLRDVVVVADGRALRIWRRGGPASEFTRNGVYAGIRVCCCGDGGDLYRAIALGPVVTLDRVLVADERAKTTPAQRLVLLTAPLLDALERLPQQAGTANPEVRPVVAAVAATADRRDAVFPDGACLQRAERDSLRWLLRMGYELELALDGQRAPRLSLYAGRAAHPFVEWVLGGSNPAVFLGNPRASEPGAGRWYGNGLPLPRVAGDLQAREALLERTYALAVMHRFEALAADRGRR